MNLKKSFSGNFGYEKIITKENSPLKYTEIDMLKLREGESYTINELNKEFVLVVYYGTCAVKGDKCYDCQSPERICNGFLIFERAMKGTETEVLLVNEELGY